MTPFMYAVLIRSYSAAMTFLTVTKTVMEEKYATVANPCGEDISVNTKTVDSLVMDYLYPPNSHLDDSPLFILCLNDVCTYTWTGACEYFPEK